MYVSTQVRAVIDASPARVFDVANDVEGIAEAFVAYGPIPGTVRCEVLGGGPLVEGATRRVHTQDGGFVEEDMLVYDRPRATSYTLRGISRPFSFLVNEGVARWEFEPEGFGTAVYWRYTFELTTPLAWGLASPLIAIVFRGWMKACLEAIAAIAESDSPETSLYAG